MQQPGQPAVSRVELGPLVRSLLEPRFLAWTLAWTVGSLVAFGLVTAIIPNPVFGRQIPPEPFAIAIWVASAPLMGLVGATYSSRRSPGAAAPFPPPADATESRGSMLGAIGGFGAFLAIGCPVCNKIALVLLGTSGALNLYAPIQPLIGVASLALLAGTLVWRLRLRARGGACAI